MKLFLQSFVLAISFLLVYIWQSLSLTPYTIPVIGFLVFLYLITLSKKKGNALLGKSASLQIFILNTLILLLVFSTESINSPIYFLLYFLAFGIAFIFNPAAVFVFTVGLILIFLPDVLRDNMTENVLKLISLVIVSPIAYFFGAQYSKNEEQADEILKMQDRAEEAADKISEDVDEVLRNEENLPSKDVEKLNEILEEANDLREERNEKPV